MTTLSVWRSKNAMKVFAGLEGGASSSKLALVSQEGHVLYEDSSSVATNHWLIGIPELLRRIETLVKKSGERSLETLTVCLSGCEDFQTNEEIRKQLQALRLAERAFVASDTLAPLFACGHSKGVVLIAGTGSNCLLFDDNDDVKCGGWGHVLGDQGSAFWVARKALKAVIAAEEDYWSGERRDARRVRDLVFAHFGLSRLSEILDKIYRKFDKSEVASLCRHLASLAEEDPLARHIFHRAGVHLGRHVKAVLPKAQESKVAVVCVGSLFKSWRLLSSGFVSVFDVNDRQITVKRLKTSSAVGAALIGALKTGHKVEMAVDQNCEVLGILKSGKWCEE